MRNLIKARMYAYFHTPLLLIAATVCLGSGLLGIPNCVFQKEYAQDVTQISPIDDMWPLMGMWTLGILTALCAGKLFSDGTIRNAISVGYTKTQVYFAEILASLPVTGILFLLTMLPMFIIGWWYFAWMPLLSAVKYVLILFLSFVVSDFLAILLAFLTTNRAISVVLVFGLEVGIYAIIGWLDGYYYNTEPREITLPITYEVNGEEVTEEVTFTNNYYIEGPLKTLVHIEHYCNMMAPVHDVDSFFYVMDFTKATDEEIVEHERSQRRQNYNLLTLTAYCALFSLGGAAVFRRKNLR